MPQWVSELPDAQIIALVVAALVAGDLLAALVYRVLVRRWLSPEATSQLLDAHRMVLTLTGLVLGFALLEVQSNFRETNDVVQQEAHTLDLSSRELRHIGIPGAARVRSQLLDYGHAIVTTEWPLLAQGKRSDTLDAKYSELLRLVTDLKPTTVGQQIVLTEVFRQLDLLGDLRDRRISAASTSLPNGFWTVIDAMVAICLLLAAGVPATLAHRYATLLPTAALGVLIAMIVIIDTPFIGQTSVGADEMQRVLNLLGPADTTDSE
jgi:hypothetical protein